jgi:CheY-like chemotaxis protein
MKDCQHLKVLVVEDEPLLLYMLADTLEEAGFSVSAVSSGDDALACLETADQNQALVTDINLGRRQLTGWDIARRAREHDPRMPVVYVTGDSAHHWTTLGVPNSILISKPFAHQEVVTALAKTISEAWVDRGN